MTCPCYMFCPFRVRFKSAGNEKMKGKRHFFAKKFVHVKKKQYLCGKIGGVNLRMAV